MLMIRLAAIEKAKFGPALMGVVSIVLLLTLIELLIGVDLLDRFVIPMPTDVIWALPRIVAEEAVIARFYETAFEVAVATLLVAAVGIGGGVVLYKSAVLRLATETWVATAAAAPTALMYPLFLVIFGRSATTIIMMGFVAGLAPVILKTLEGLSGTRRVYIDVGRSFRLSSWQQFWQILFPAAMPTIFVGVRLGLIFALINIVAMEFLISFGGLGQLINELAERYDLAGTYAAICFVIVVSVCVFVATEKVERWLRPAE